MTEKKQTSSITKVNVAKINGERIDWAALLAKGAKALLVVNTASACGFTPQYKGLQELHERFAKEGLVILGTPCNQFGAQEPGAPSTIQAFCEGQFGVQFMLSEKLFVKGADQHPLYQWLLSHSSSSVDVAWNFEKFLVPLYDDAAAKTTASVQRFMSKVEPQDPAMVVAIQDVLKG